MPTALGRDGLALPPSVPTLHVGENTAGRPPLSARGWPQQACGRRGLRLSTIYLLLAILGCSCCLGCARWSSESLVEADVSLPKPKMSPDSVTIETVLVRFPLESTEKLNEIWHKADESLLDIQLRQQLDKNGVRAGLIVGDLPLAIRERLSEASYKQSTDALEYAGLAADVDNKMRQLRCRAGRRKELIVRREIADPITVVTSLNGRLTGETFLRATALFDLRVIPHPDGQATIQLTPEIQHGDHQQTYVSTEFGVRPEIKRHQASWPALSLEAKLSPGQILLVSSTLPPKAVGGAFFLTKTAEQTEEHVLLLVRLAATQLDDLFAPEGIEKANAYAER